VRGRYLSGKFKRSKALTQATIRGCLRGASPLFSKGADTIRRVKERLRLSYIIIPPPFIREGDKGGGLPNKNLKGLSLTKLSQSLKLDSLPENA